MWQFRFKIGPIEPRAFGIIRFKVVAWPATAAFTTNASGFMLRLFSAFAIADFNVLATKRADLRGTAARTATAWRAGNP